MCRERAEIEIARQQAETDKAQLDYQLVRALKCTELIQMGAFLHPSSPYGGLCADVIAMGSDGLLRNGVGQVVGGVSTQDKPSPSSQEEVQSTTSREGFRLPFLSSARKCGEVINRKYFARSSRSKSSTKQNQQETKENNVVANEGSFFPSTPGNYFFLQKASTN